MDTLLNENQGNLITMGYFPADFWKLLYSPITKDDWEEAGQDSIKCLADLPVFTQSRTITEVANKVLTEYQFGPGHFRLKTMKRLYYSLIRPFLPEWVRLMAKHVLKNQLIATKPLNWPIEDRYVQFQWDLIGNLLKKKRLNSIPYIHFWPDGKRYAFVLTHDVEDVNGQIFVRQLADLEEKYGFHSSYNFVPEKYPVDCDLLTELKARGFEVGVHGLHHDGGLFSSQETFLRQAAKINRYLKDWEVVGFRSPFTHRNPEWMQALDIEYDSSFFDTDPFEPMPGGTMSIWPFIVGRFVELPYTLVQDHSLMVTLGEESPKIWLEKAKFLRRYCGMVLILSHPDYLRQPNHLAIYEDFLKEMSDQQDFWHALPKDVARWWRKRNQLIITDGSLAEPNIPSGITIGEIRQIGNTIELFPNEKESSGVLS